MDSALMELVPIAQNLYLLFSELHTECEFYKLEHHLFNHSELETIGDFPLHLIASLEKLTMKYEDIMLGLTLRKYNLVGQGMGGILGHLFKLTGAEKLEPIVN